MNILDLVKKAGYDPKRKASTHGGEYCSPCPFCKEGNDRFLTWPNRPNNNGSLQGGRFSCRVCRKYGDAITFLRDLHGLSYPEACDRLRLTPKEKSYKRIPKVEQPLPKADDPPVLWQEKASSFVEWCHRKLLDNPEALQQVLDRGFTRDSIIRFKLGYNPGEAGYNGYRQDFYRQREDWGLDLQYKEDGQPKRLWLPIGLVIPTFSADGQVIKVKVRRSNWTPDDKLPKYVEISESKKCFSIYGDTTLPACLIMESEFDALLIQQFAGDLLYSVALGGSTKPLDFDTDKLLRKTPCVLFCPDFDVSGATAWSVWKKKFPDIQRILTPDGKAPGDAYTAGVDLREWITESLKEIKRKREKNL